MFDSDDNPFPAWDSHPKHFSESMGDSASNLTGNLVGDISKPREPVVLASDRTVFFDIDDTLIIYDKVGTGYKPHLAHIDLLKRFHMRNQPVIIWSAGGYLWAKKIVYELGLEKYVTLIMSKPAWWVDDLRADEVLFEVNRIYIEPPKEE